MTNILVLNNEVMSLLNRTGTATDLPQPFVRDILLLECHIAGTAYRSLNEIEPALHAGDELTLRREPGNEHDHLAIQILTANGAHLGYVPRAKNETLARLMDAGKFLCAKLKEQSRENRWVKINVQIFMREL
jgi:HIRAN domain-containing protein